MSANAIFFGWNRSLPGRESLSAQHFQDYVAYLNGLDENGTIDSFDIVFLDPHGGDLNGFFLIRGQTDKLQELMSTAGWNEHITRATLHLDHAGAVLAVTGPAVADRMKLWTSLIPS